KNNDRAWDVPGHCPETKGTPVPPDAGTPPRPLEPVRVPPPGGPYPSMPDGKWVELGDWPARLLTLRRLYSAIRHPMPLLYRGGSFRVRSRTPTAGPRPANSFWPGSGR